LIFFLLLFLIFFSIYALLLIYSSLNGSPYVGTNNKKIVRILTSADLKKDSFFIDLGCGDGRVVLTAVSNFKVKGIGVDINPFLIKIANLKAKIQSVDKKSVKFICQNILKTDITGADFIYLFLLPNLIKRLKPKLEKELKKNTIIISHGFKIEGWEKKLIKKLPDLPFPTYYYKI